MNKKLVVLALAGVMVAPSLSYAAIEVFGKARVSVNMDQNDDATAGNEDTALGVSSNNSRIGFKGEEPAGSGMKVEWLFEQAVDFDGAPGKGGAAGGSTPGEGVDGKKDTFYPRNTYVGLNGGFGTVRLGRHDTPNKIASTPLDPFGDTRGDFNAVIAGDARADNAIVYITPDMSGFQGLLAYVTSYTDDQLTQTTLDSDKTAVSLAGIYKSGPLYAAVAHETLSDAIAVGSDLVNTKLGASYTFGATMIGGLWENVDMDTDKRDNFHVSLTHKIGDTSLRLGYGMQGETDNTKNDAADQFALGVFQNLSKTTEVYALYTGLSNDPSSGNDLKGFSGPAGKDQSSFSVGINHNFSSK